MSETIMTRNESQQADLLNIRELVRFLLEPDIRALSNQRPRSTQLRT